MIRIPVCSFNLSENLLIDSSAPAICTWINLEMICILDCSLNLKVHSLEEITCPNVAKIRVTATNVYYNQGLLVEGRSGQGYTIAGRFTKHFATEVKISALYMCAESFKK
jgi:hypothetical protein